MKQDGKLEPQDWMTAPASRAVLSALQAEGAEVRFVGGCVRDALAGRRVKDIDLDRGELTIRRAMGARDRVTGPGPIDPGAAADPSEAGARLPPVRSRRRSGMGRAARRARPHVPHRGVRITTKVPSFQHSLGDVPAQILR